ncbi:hypothetical protein H2200_013521 [Cladophialophora chaetospira]|uniref:Glutathione S-transferase n=1 Tax=Cladophialophora chaetospira TaxID=386627 RepID=A0AA38WPX8_9EURO|nr:hypothetical protein H2200_013521 [Cladophialophora chaetospira]
MGPKLYCCPESGNCYKVRLLASLLDISLEKVELDFFHGAHKTPEFLAINPKGELPALVDGDILLTDSSAVLVYLAGTHPDPGSSKTPSNYWSAEAVEQAQIVDWLAFTASYISGSLSKARAFKAFNWPPNTSEESIKEAKARGVKSLKVLETKLEKSDWLALGRPTVADIAIYVYVALAPMGDISLEPFAAVKAWLERVKALPGYIPLTGLDQPF